MLMRTRGHHEDNSFLKVILLCRRSKVFSCSYQYDCMVGLLKLFNAHILPHIHITIEATARVFGRLCERVDDVLRRRNDANY